MDSEYFKIEEKVLNLNNLTRKYVNGNRLIFGFKNATEIRINGVKYKKVKGIDIDAVKQCIEITTDKETVKLKIKEFKPIEVSFDEAIRFDM